MGDEKERTVKGQRTIIGKGGGSLRFSVMTGVLYTLVLWLICCFSPE